jgi:LCCL domain
MNPLIRASGELQRLHRDGLLYLAGAIFLTGLFTSPAQVKGFQDEPAPEQPKPKAEPGAAEVRFTDNSVFKLLLRDERVEIVTPYGKLLVPIADIQRIEFATRLSEADAKRIPVLIANLGSADFPVRDAASAELWKLREKAYPALLKAAKHTDPEVVRRVTELLDKIRETVPKENLEVRAHDVIYTEDSKFTGRIGSPALKANTTQFGEVQLKLVDMHSLRSPSATVPVETEVANALPAPTSLMQFQNQIGQTFKFKVTGALNGALWGTDVYTLDSTVGMAAVHAGILKPGQTGFVKVKFLPSPGVFQGSNRNGVTSEAYGAFPAAFQFVR